MLAGAIAALIWANVSIGGSEAVHASGVHATVAGVALGLAIPVGLGERLEHTLHPYRAFVVVPLFALANAGVDVRVFGDAAVGFTVSLFIADLAFDVQTLVNEAKVGIFAGSILSGMLGAVLLARRGAR